MTSPSDPRIVVLWDIDGTLIEEYRGEGTGLQRQAVREALGLELAAPAAKGGATERMVWTRMFDENGVPEPADLSPVEAAVDRLYDELLARRPRVALAGAREAVEALADAGIVNALLTGNGGPVARRKLASAGFDLDRFDWDAAFFGREWRDRVEMARAARVAHPRAVIVGDTVHDGACAVGSGIPWIAVGTGGRPFAELAEYDPTAWFERLDGRTAELVAAVREAAQHVPD